MKQRSERYKGHNQTTENALAKNEKRPKDKQKYIKK